MALLNVIAQLSKKIMDLPCRTIILKIIVLYRKGGEVFENEVNMKKNIFSENGSSEARCGLLSFRTIGDTTIFMKFTAFFCRLE